MDREANHHHHHQNQETITTPSISLLSNKQPQTTTTTTTTIHAANNSDRVKRDEWSEGAVSTLLEAYEAKWVLRNRAKLKGQDWEDVAKHVSARGNHTRSPKTQTQCKNKIESMKKRYRSESATAAEASSWPLYPRLDLLLRGNAPPPPLLPPPQAVVATVAEPTEPAPVPSPPPATTVLPAGNGDQNSHGSNGLDRIAKEDIMDVNLSDNASDHKNEIDTDSSTPALYSNDDKDNDKLKNVKPRQERKKKRKRDESEGCEIAESIRLLAEVVVRSEQARMETMREIERMRVEAEAKRGEMELKRTEIIANTQLEIAKLFASISKGSLDSSLKIGRS